MCCDNLVCASCARPVADGGCAVCRSARAELHARPGYPVATLALMITLLGLVALLLTRI
jgi:hypothetical protein